MKRVIFYSWQSDLDAPIARTFIENALNAASRKIEQDDVLLVEPVIERDTAGLAGSPDIADAIFAKIARCDVYVSDVSSIGRD